MIVGTFHIKLFSVDFFWLELIRNLTVEVALVESGSDQCGQLFRKTLAHFSEIVCIFLFFFLKYLMHFTGYLFNVFKHFNQLVTSRGHWTSFQSVFFKLENCFQYTHPVNWNLMLIVKKHKQYWKILPRSWHGTCYENIKICTKPARSLHGYQATRSWQFNQERLTITCYTKL